MTKQHRNLRTKRQWSQIKTKLTNTFNTARGWLYILSSAHLPQITTYFLRYSHETALVNCQETCCVLCFVWNFSNFNRFEQEKAHFERPRRQSCALAKLATFFTFLAGKSLLPLISDFTIVSSVVACCYLGLRQAGLRLFVSFRMRHWHKSSLKGFTLKKQIWSLP